MDLKRRMLGYEGTGMRGRASNHQDRLVLFVSAFLQGVSPAEQPSGDPPRGPSVSVGAASLSTGRAAGGVIRICLYVPATAWGRRPPLYSVSDAMSSHPEYPTENPDVIIHGHTGIYDGKGGTVAGVV